MEHSAPYVALVSVGFACGVLGTFYLSAQAIGFDNLKTLQQNLSKLIDELVAPKVIEFVDGEGDVKAPPSTKSLLKRGIIIAISVGHFIAILFNVMVVHFIVGIILVIIWLFVPAMFGLVIASWLKIVVAVALYAVGGGVLDERPHRGMARVFQFFTTLLRRHFEWVEEGTRQSGRTGILGFSLVSTGLICYFVANLVL